MNTGTVNFAHLSPFYCVSIGFVVEGKPVIGVINAPFLQQIFSAHRGKGAWLNETQRLPLHFFVRMGQGPSIYS
jgi:myo-inositol-1(or 4)-monophosphatase